MRKLLLAAALLLTVACNRPIVVEADAKYLAEKWAAQQGWVPDEIHCNPRPEKAPGTWSCFIGNYAQSAAVWCEPSGCSKIDVHVP